MKSMKEIRIGDWFLTGIKLRKAQIHDTQKWWTGERHGEPAPVTEDFLKEKWEFCSNWGGNYYKGIGPSATLSFVFYIERNQCVLEVTETEEKVRTIKYIHEIQQLYYLLTGKNIF